MEGFDELIEGLTNGLNALPASFTSIWIPIQLAMIALSALIGWAVAAAVRRRVNVLP